MSSKRYFFLSLAVLIFVPATHAGQQITATEYRNRMEGMWVGQLLGNYAGRHVEGRTTVYYEGPNSVDKPVTEYQVQWDAIMQGKYYGKNSPTLYGDTTTPASTPTPAALDTNPTAVISPT